MSVVRTLKTTAWMVALGTGSLAQAQEASLDLVGRLADYKIYVAEQMEHFLGDTRKFVAAIKSGDLDGAKALYAPTRASYEAVEPIAELFADIDAAIDARADDFEQGETDPAFTGFHRIEYGLWEEGSTEGLGTLADKLLADVTDLNNRIAGLTFPPEVVVGGAAVLMEEVAATKISGEEDRYSHSDLWDFDANFKGSEQIYTLLKPLLDAPDFVSRTDANFQAVYDVLAKYQTPDGGYVTYDHLSDEDRTILSAKVNTLAEDLSTLRGMLGLI